MTSHNAEHLRQFLDHLNDIEEAMTKSEEFLGLPDGTPVELLVRREQPLTVPLRMSEELRRLIRAYMRDELDPEHRQMKKTLERMVQELGKET